MTKQNLAILIFLVWSSSIEAFEFVEVTNVVTKVSYNTESQKPFIELTSKKDINKIITPSNTVCYIPFNRGFGVLTFSILSPKKSKMYLKWDNPDSLYSRVGKVIKFMRAGDYKSISFNATKPLSGFIYLMNSKGKILKKIHYTVKKQNKYLQSIRTYFNKSEFGTNSGNSNENITLNYNISKRINFGEPRWDLGITTSTNLNNSNTKTIGVGIGYSW